MNHKLCYSPAESAQQLGICKNNLYKYLDNGDLRSFKLGQRRLINREALDDFRQKLEKLHMAEMRGEDND
jgi:excisionase family DNA binding protein